MWWNCHGISYGFSLQVGNYLWNCVGVYYLLAVTYASLYKFSKLTKYSRDTPFTYFPRTETGDSQFDFFKKVVSFYPIGNLLAAQDWNLSAAGSQFAVALFTLLYVEFVIPHPTRFNRKLTLSSSIVDTTATLYSMARFSGVVDPQSGDFPRSTIAYCCDAFSISIGSLFGLSPVSAFVESGAGITEGGKTGLTSITTGICFLISIFFAPIFASIPPWATGCTLILVSFLLLSATLISSN